MILETSPEKISSSKPSGAFPAPPPPPPKPIAGMAEEAGPFSMTSCLWTSAAVVFAGRAFLGITTDSFVIVLIFEVNFSMRSSLFFNALFSFSLMKI